MSLAKQGARLGCGAKLRHQLAAATNVQFAEDRVQRVFRAPERAPGFVGNLLIALARTDEANEVAFPLRERAERSATVTVFRRCADRLEIDYELRFADGSGMTDAQGNRGAK